MPALDEWAAPDLAALVAEAAAQRPEFQQLAHGKQAAAALERSERLAMAPVVFVAGQFRWSWAPTRHDVKNPYQYDPYNDLFGGVAVGLKFDLDPALALAKADSAHAIGEQVDALDRLAQTGIPLRIRAALSDAVRFRAAAELSGEGVRAAQKWLAFAGAAYVTGTGEAKDLLEGLVAFLGAKRGHYESLQRYYQARAELDYAVGRQ
jgi:hypothetical protein